MLDIIVMSIIALIAFIWSRLADDTKTEITAILSIVFGLIFLDEFFNGRS